LDEFFEALTLIQTNKIGRFPIVLVGKEYWAGLVDWIKTRLLQKDLHYISEADLELFCVVDTATEAVKMIDEFYSKYLLSPNF
jgi:predicted Rossmann-fold nucleotide-binding protein